MLDTVGSNFIDFGAVAINSDGEIVFRGILKGRQEGVFIARNALTSQAGERSGGKWKHGNRTGKRDRYRG